MTFDEFHRARPSADKASVWEAALQENASKLKMVAGMLQKWVDMFEPVERPNTDGSTLLSESRQVIRFIKGERP
jgi:hypothetical protein